MTLLGYSVPETITDDAGNALKGVEVAVTGPSAYSGTATSDATTGVLQLGPLPPGDYTVTLNDRSAVVPVIASAADIIAAAAAAAPALAPVQTVAGRTGAVVLAKADVGLGSVDNTADSAKPVSTQQQAALDLKANLASPVLTGNPTAPTQTAGNNSTRLATTAYADSAVAAEQTRAAGAYLAIAPAPSGDTSGAIDTAALAAVIAAMPTTGGRLLLQAGAYYLSSALTLDRPVRFEGVGGALTGDAGQATPRAQTTIYVSSGTNNGIVIASDGCTLLDFAIVNTSSTTPTAGSGVLVTAGEFTRMARVSIVKFYDDLRFDDGFYYTVTDCTFTDPVRYGAYFRNATSGEMDHGDQSVMGCTFTLFYTSRTPTAAVHWESGGGLRFENCKVNGNTQPGNASAGTWSYGLHLTPADGVVTSVFLINGNSIENVGTGLLAQPLGTTGSIGKIVVTGNEFLMTGSAYGVLIQGLGPTTQYVGIVVAGNMLQLVGGGRAIQLKNASGTVGKNFAYSAQYGLYLDSGCSVDFVPQTIVGTGYYFNEFGGGLATTAASTIPACRSSRSVTREIPGSVTSTSAVNVVRVELPSYASGIIEVTVAGTASGVASFLMRATRAVTTGNGGSATLATIGTDYAGGVATAQASLGFSNGGTTSVTISLALAAGATATGLVGEITVKLDGNIAAVYRY